MKKSVIVLTSMLLLSMLALSACGSSGSGNSGNNGGNAAAGKDNGSEQQTAGGSSQEPVTIRFATWDTGQSLQFEQEVAKQFEQKHPNIKVQVEPYGDGFDQKMSAGFGAGDPPDVMYMYNFPTYKESLEPLDSYIEKDADLNIDDFYPGLLNYDRIDGVTYGLPVGFTTRVVYYNKKLFDEAGVAYPQDGWTWDDLKQMAVKLTDKSKKQYGIGMRASVDVYGLQGTVWSNGGSYVSDDGKQIDGYMNGKETVEALETQSNAIKDGYGVLVGGKNQQSGDDIFKAGKIAMWETGLWPLQGFKDANMDFGTVVTPAFGDKPLKGVINESAISIAKDSKHKEEAWEFLKFFVSPESIKIRTADLPVRSSTAKEMNLSEDPLYKPFYTMLDRSTNIPAFLLNPKWDQIDSNLATAVEAIMLGNDAQDAMDQAVKDSEKYLNH
ncbi:ABC transporter substrate-binding protein [Paenibacillus physcomitrellae]|uniref:Sugar ABC transporter substrate-binding protein n=1 Tax=Paenibacillus physcomitrellae TaxID=1619311 RepID=A0ABQ1GE86_9BACL|nr:sugar ABC transporter substrate-binding protein [Paenibacillus physcomitrellae]GGA42132.1 sugar ABC transporter substrate-binding protein [Paenibacillus physcomitrellae]